MGMLMPLEYATAANLYWAGTVRMASTVLKVGGGGRERFSLSAALAVLVCALYLLAAGPPPASVSAQGRWMDLPAPTGIAAVNGENPGEVIISWNPAAGAAYYRIARIAAADADAITESGGDWLSAIAYANIAAAASVDADTDTQHTLTRLNPGARYTFLVGALRAKDGTPSWSLPAELNLTAGILAADESLPMTVPVGLTTNEPGASDGYILFSPSSNAKPYLIDRAGRIIHRWDHTMRQTRLLENGNIMGVNVGWIYEIDPSGNVLWRYRHPQRQHHDWLRLPNGNVLLLVREIKTAEEAIAAGANPAFMHPDGLEIDAVVEVRPVYPDRAEIVWKWSVWDHLVQDYDYSKANFGIVAEHPELVDLNYNLRQMARTEQTRPTDWTHANGLDYNPELDQILLSARNMSEIWIIDHSTTTEEAARHSGGNGGRGGDLLYRWGNPQAYRAGAFADQQLFWQHNPHWIPEGRPGAGNILIFSNAAEYEGRYLNHASVVEITPPASGYGYDKREAGGVRYGPAQPTWTYVAENPADFIARRFGNTQRLSNGNTLVFNGHEGVIFEVTPDGATAWRYVNPVVASGPIYQGDPISVRTRRPTQPAIQQWENSFYRAYRYASNYPGLQHYDLTPKGTLERYRNAGQ